MSFLPLIPTGGYAGWRFLQRTLEQQAETHARTPAAQRDETYFRERIGQVTSAAELVDDRRLLSITLAAFGLSDDLPNRAFIQRVLESPAGESRSFVNRLADKRYTELASAFDFASDAAPRNQEPDFADKMLSSFRARRFEEAVGQQDQSMRLALALKRDLSALASSGQSEEAQWFRVLGTPSLRKVFETAFQLPTSFGALDLDRQVDILRMRTKRAFGEAEIAQFTDPEKLERLARNFFTSEQVSQIKAISGQAAALTLLQSAQENMAALRRRK